MKRELNCFLKLAFLIRYDNNALCVFCKDCLEHDIRPSSIGRVHFLDIVDILCLTMAIQLQQNDCIGLLVTQLLILPNLLFKLLI